MQEQGKILLLIKDVTEITRKIWVSVDEMYQYFSDFEDVFLKKKKKETNKKIRDKGGIILTASIQGIQDKHPGEEKATAVKI